MQYETELSPEASKAIETVTKLLAVARNAGANEAEAQNALDRAHVILEKHNLDMALVERRAGDSAAPQAKRSDKSQGGGLYRWQREIWENTAKLNMCVYKSIRGLEKGQKYENRLIGRAENVIMTRVMAEYLQSTIERIAAEWAKDQGYSSRFVKKAIIFREGMAETIGERLRDLHRQRVEESKRKAEEMAAAARHPGAAPGTSLMLASVIQTEDDYNTDYLQGLEPGTTARLRAERDARMATYAALQRAFEERRKLWKADKAEYMRLHGEDAEDIARQKREDKTDHEWELHCAGKRTETYGAGYKPARPSRAMGFRRGNEADRRRSDPAFYKGRSEGQKVGLDTQIGKDRNQGKLK